MLNCSACGDAAKKQSIYSLRAKGGEFLPTSLPVDYMRYFRIQSERAFFAPRLKAGKKDENNFKGIAL